MTGGPARTRHPRHQGILYTDRASLVSAVIPLVTRALTDGHAVVAVVDRATARELEEALPDARIAFPPPSVLATHGSSRFATGLASWAAAGPVLVVTQYAPGPGSDPPGELPLTLVCACAGDADPAVLAAFHHDHEVMLDACSDEWANVSVRTSLAEAGDLAGLRRDVRRAAVGAGFHGYELDRTVLAVHEAAVVAVRQLRGPRCHLEIRTRSGRLHADVVVPDGPSSGDDGAEGADGTDLGSVRPFCRATSVHDDGRGRSIRVLALAGS